MSAQEEQYQKRSRAGLIPYIADETGTLLYLMMVSSNSKFGGPRPMISKGKIEDGESELECAIREAREELGLEVENMLHEPKMLSDEQVILHSGSYQLTLFAVPVQNRWNFGKWCSETEFIVWHSAAEFQLEGRKDHVKYVLELDRQLRNGER